jgi:membrane fusion protein, multidrug efflux system
MALLRWVSTVVAIGAIAGGVYLTMRGGGAPESTETGRHGHGRNGGSGGPVSVIAKIAETADVPVYLEGVGSVKALNTATIRAQVDGRLLSVNFKEGQDVKRGDVLAKIDPATYQAQLDQAVAKKALDEALLANTKHDLERFQKVGTLAISQQQIDTQIALIKQQEAQIKSDIAAIENAQAILGYTTIVAPFDGRTGIRLTDEGNLVHANDTTGIVMMTQVQPITTLFTLPQQELPTLTKAIAAGALTAHALSTDSQTELDAGTLKVIDNQVDQQTGTIKLKAEFPNSKRDLWPGQFVNVRLLVDTLKGVTVVATEAIQRGPDGTYVFVIGADDTVEMRNIKVSRQDEKFAVVAEGVTPGEKVVTSGFSRLKDGSTVSVSDGKSPASEPTSEKPRHKKKSPDAKRSSSADENAEAEQSSKEAALVTGSNPDDGEQRPKSDHRDGGASQ